MIKSLVTGGAGFIGSHLVDKLLANGHEVVAIDNFFSGGKRNIEHNLDNKNFTFKKIDIRKKNQINELSNDFDYVFHLAGIADIVPSIENPVDYFDTNVKGTLNLLEFSRTNNLKKFLYAASSSCYGLAKNFPTRETDPISPEYPYALTKYLGEEMVKHWGYCYKMPVNSLRLFNVYGPRSRTSGAYGAVFGVFLSQKINNKPFTIVGDGKQTRDFTFVTDVASAFYEVAISDVINEVFNIGSGSTYSINQLIDLLGGEKVFIPRRPGEPDCTFADTSKIKKLINWTPRVSFVDGVKVMLDNIDLWKDAPLWDEKSIEKATKSWFEYKS
jgi:UDP-glucose 4-epimerase